MIITNKENLPEVFIRALNAKQYSPGTSDYTATNFTNSPRIVLLGKRRGKEIATDISENIWSMFGDGFHMLMNSFEIEDALQEERIYYECLDRVISGQTDHWHNRKITDFKVTSVWTIIYGSRIKEWGEQLNVYAFLFRKAGFEVDKIEIIALLRDWSKLKAKTDKQYPQNQVKVIPIELWDVQKQEIFILNRLQEFIDCEELPDDELPYCTPDDMWESPNKYAVMKDGRKSALRVFDDFDDATEFLDKKPKRLKDTEIYIEYRQGRRVRCHDYCNVSPFCNQYKDYKEALVKENIIEGETNEVES